MTRLSGRVVATTRDGDPADPLVAGLRAEGADVLEWVTVRFAPGRSPDALARAAAELDSYDWVVFTSARSIAPIADRVTVQPRTPRLAAVGAATAATLHERGWTPAVVGNGGAAALATRMAEADALDGARVLFPAASRASRDLEHALASRGAEVIRVEAYQTLPARPDGDVIRSDLARGVDIVTFTSPTAIESLGHSLAEDWPAVLQACAIAAIGPTTAAAAREAGLPQVTQAAETSIASLIETCVDVVRGGGVPDA